MKISQQCDLLETMALRIIGPVESKTQRSVTDDVEFARRFNARHWN